ncbi:MAG: DUF4998 domain-containing protein [Mangrovibacterium sp.]
MKYFKIYLLIMMAALVSCESMDDTYSDLFDGNKKRYVGKCSDLKIEKGLQRFKLSWENSTDATIENIRIVWVQGTESDTILLPKGTTSYVTEATFQNKSYEFSVSAIDGEGNKSIDVSDYARPYTKDSELVNLLKVVQRSYYFVENKLIMFLYDQELQSESYVNYYSNGVLKSHQITTDEFEELLVIIENVDAETDVNVKSTVEIEDCFDKIEFDPYQLDRNARNYAADFVNMLKTRYDLSDIPSSLTDTLTTLHVDEDLSTIENILYMPNLQKVILGGERYMIQNYAYLKDYMCSFTNKTASVLALEIMHDYFNVELDIYGNQYLIRDEIDFENQFIIPTLPSIEFLTMSSWSVTTNYDLDDNGDVKNLIALSSDGTPDKTKYWKPREILSEVRTHEVIVDMKAFKTLNGIYVAQHPTAGTWESVSPDAIEVLVSTNKTDWVQPFKTFRSIYLNKSPGEVNIINFAEKPRARYVKMVVKDKITSGNNYVVVSSFIPF